MSVLDKVIATVTPSASPEERAEARARANDLAVHHAWFAAILQRHQQIENAFHSTRIAPDPAARRTAERELAALLTAHSMAEEAVIYPAMALGDQKLHATEAYTEQSATKVNLAALEGIEPMSQDYLDKLEHVRNAVELHVHQEESSWFPALACEAEPGVSVRLSARYVEEHGRYRVGLSHENEALPPSPGLASTSATGMSSAGTATTTTSPGTGLATE